MDVHLIVSESRFIQRCPQDDDVTWFRLPWPCVAGLRRVLGQQSPDDLRPSSGAGTERSGVTVALERVVSGQVAALYVETGGAYYGLPGVHPWDQARDARGYAGPWPVVAHPPCQRWGRFWHGSTRRPHQYKKGDDGGCFEAALRAVRTWGGVLEHPCDSHAWAHFGLTAPKRHAGWRQAGDGIGWTCYVEQGHYGHASRKPTWLYAARTALPELDWSKGAQRLHPVALERYGYEKARRIGITAMVGGKDKTRIRNATPPEFRDLLLQIARTAGLPANKILA